MPTILTSGQECAVARRRLPPAAMRIFETHADLIEAYLIDRASTPMKS
jgi:hypothetical protein